MHRVDLKDGTSSPVSPEWTGTFLGAQPISPDGATVLLSGGKRPLDPGYEIYPIAGGRSRSLPGTAAGDIPLRWTADGRGFLVFNRDGLPARVHRIDINTGQRALVREILPANPEGIAGIRSLLLSDDGRTVVYSYVRELSDLYLIEGLK